MVRLPHDRTSLRASDPAFWYAQFVTFYVHLGMGLKVILWWFLFRIPVVKTHFIRYMQQNKNNRDPLLDEDDLAKSMASYKSWVGMSRSATVDALKATQLYGPMVDSELIKLDKQRCKISDFMKKGRPLVVNLGSCT